ncbi:MAG: Cardiolipin synthetase [uncultured Acidimicrobiales bacterium]|uniref:Cardiolipin synthetase n=1 Tax=uncultured Acidimicrobiales bacterium TaxID=310071 RepID=A0A6J4I7Q8_9ACTN|nr:MAG: Cardiolipin synthetase [uncultured Acidimicrobiales bacterium]
MYAYGTAKYRRNAKTTYDFRDPPAPGSAEFDRLLSAVSGSTPTSGNRVSVLRNGGRTFPSMLAAIASATSTIDLSSYIYWPGEVASAFTEALAERARAGVEVNVILDGWGSAKLDRATVRTLEEAGANVAIFRPPKWYTVHKLNNRMHRRLLIVDGRIAFAGGVGIADVWGGDAEDPEHWRETHISVEGPAVLDILGGFLENWTEAAKVVLGPAHYPKAESFDDGVDVQVMRSSPKAGGTVTLHLFNAAIAGARERLWITTAFLAPGDAFVRLLSDAARRGVDVRLLTNGPNIDKEVVRQVGQRCYGPLLHAGVRIFEYQQTMLHAKVLIVDDWADVGSSNLDHRSLGLDDEVNIAVRDPQIVSEVARQFLEDLELSKEFDLERWGQRTLAKRVAEAATDLFRQSL